MKKLKLSQIIAFLSIVSFSVGFGLVMDSVGAGLITLGGLGMFLGPMIIVLLEE